MTLWLSALPPRPGTDVARQGCVGRAGCESSGLWVIGCGSRVMRAEGVGGGGGGVMQVTIYIIGGNTTQQPQYPEDWCGCPRHVLHHTAKFVSDPSVYDCED